MAKSLNDPVAVRAWCDIDGYTLADLTQAFSDFAAGYGADLASVRLAYEYDEGVYLVGFRPPTEAEVETRRKARDRAAKASAAAKAKKEEREKKEFERLAKKYGNKA